MKDYQHLEKVVTKRKLKYGWEEVKEYKISPAQLKLLPALGTFNKLEIQEINLAFTQDKEAYIELTLEDER